MSEPVRIPVHRRGQEPVFALVDADNAHLAEHHWHLTRSGAMTHIKRPNPDKQKGLRHRTLLMHRVVTQAPQGDFVVPLDGDHLNCRRSNLRVVNGTELRLLDPPRGPSGYKGVKRDKNGWRVSINTPDGRVHLGRFSDPAEAARAWDRSARAYHGDLVKTNEDLGLLSSPQEKGTLSTSPA